VPSPLQLRTALARVSLRQGRHAWGRLGQAARRRGTVSTQQAACAAGRMLVRIEKRLVVDYVVLILLSVYDHALNSPPKGGRSGLYVG
jgi:hypothetical protein